MATVTQLDVQHATIPQESASYATAIPIRSRYDNWLNGEYKAPVRRQYFSNPAGHHREPLCDVASSTAEDVELALDAAHAAADRWGRTPPAERALILHRIADRV
jgi:aldehyde dehydrogenase